MEKIISSSGDTPLFQTYDTDKGNHHVILCGEDILFNNKEDRFDFIMDYLDLAAICSEKLG